MTTTYKRNARAQQYIRWLRTVGKTATATHYPRANAYELAVIEQLAAQLGTAVRNAARLEPGPMEVER